MDEQSAEHGGTLDSWLGLSRHTDSSAVEMLALIRELYAVEDLAKSDTANLRRELREAKSQPILERIRIWLETRRADTLPKSPLGQAIGYARAQWTALNRYVENGDLNIDNNRSENALRKVALGRKNYLFFGNDEGGRRAAIFYSLIVSCKLRGLNPAEYLKGVLVRIDSTPATEVASSRLLTGKPPPPNDRSPNFLSDPERTSRNIYQITEC